MDSRFERIWDGVPTDGASAAPGLSLYCNQTQDELLEAWTRERHECVELGLYLDRAVVLLRRILTEENVSPRTRRSVVRFLKAVRENQQQPRDDDDLV